MKKPGPKPLGPGRGRKAPTHGVRCSWPAWRWLQAQAQRAGFSSVGAWAEAHASPVGIPPAGVDVDEPRVDTDPSAPHKRTAAR